MDVTSCLDMSVDVAASMSVANTGSYLSSIRDPLFDDIAGAYLPSIRNPSLAPHVGPTSLGDTASGGFPLTALGRYTEPDDSLAQAQDWFWTHTIERDRVVSSGSDLSLDTYAEFNSRSVLDRYFAEEGTRRVVLLLLVQMHRLDLVLGPGGIQPLPKAVHVFHLIQASCHHSSRNPKLRLQEPL